MIHNGCDQQFKLAKDDAVVAVDGCQLAKEPHESACAVPSVHVETCCFIHLQIVSKTNAIFDWRVHTSFVSTFRCKGDGVETEKRKGCGTVQRTDHGKKRGRDGKHV